MRDEEVAPARSWFKERSWLLLLGCAFIGVYLSLSFLFVGIGRALPANSLDNPVLDTIVAVAPFNLKAREAKASWLREYAMTLDPEDRVEPMQRVISLLEPATQWRPKWPYYHLALLDAEYLIDSSPEVLQARYDILLDLAPNERGVDSYMIEVALRSWSKIRPDQKELIVLKLTRSKSHILDPLLWVIEEEVSVHPELCHDLPQPIVQPYCPVKG
ncbi:hypothetical protein [Thalassolituus sp.]|uniref:hypothetical protein n=1 Tax=Thalassolituus sp. TaxID=2030822 RepID=UPI00351714B9